MLLENGLACLCNFCLGFGARLDEKVLGGQRRDRRSGSGHEGVIPRPQGLLYLVVEGVLRVLGRRGAFPSMGLGLPGLP